MSIVLSPLPIIPTSYVTNYDGITIRIISDVISKSIFLEEQLPQFVRDDHPKFVEFMKSYHDWLNIQGNIDNSIQKFKHQLDIDTASEQYGDVLHKEFLSIIPKDLVADRSQILKYAKQFYRAKGSEKSFKLFFRMLYDAKVEFYYPRTDILKASDGKWIQNKSLRVVESRSTSNKQEFFNKVVTGKTSGASAFVDRVISLRTKSFVAKELFLNIYSITGKFLPGEEITTSDGAKATISPVISKIEFKNDSNTNRLKTGFGYSVGDSFFIDYGSENKAKVEVASVNADGSVRRFSIKDFGIGCPLEIDSVDVDYRISDKLSEYAVSHLSNTFTYAYADGYAIVDISNFDTYDDAVVAEEFFQPNTFVKLQGVDDLSQTRELLFVIENITSYDSATGHKILNLSLKFDDFEGSHVIPETLAIQKITSISGIGAQVKVSAGALCEYPGYYLGNYGQLSEGKFLQDNLFYQQFSYVLYSNVSLDAYKSNLNSILHPISMKLFAGFRDPTNVSAKVRSNKNSSFKRKFDKFSRPHLLPHNSPVGAIENTNFRTEDSQYAPVSMKTKARVFVKLRKDYTQLSSSNLGPSYSSIFRDRFKYLPTKDTPSIFELSNNSESSPTKIFTTPPNSLPTANSSVDWLDSFDDSDSNISYNTGTANGYWNGSSTKDNALYWGTQSTTVGRYANIQIHHFATTVPRSLDGFGVPDVAIFKNGNILHDNLDYIVQESPYDNSYFGKMWKVKLLCYVDPEDVFTISFKDRRGKIVIQNVSPEGKVVSVPREVGVKSPCSKINMMPEAIITKGV